MPAFEITEVNDLIDQCIVLEEDPECMGNAGRMFNKLLLTCFFKEAETGGKNLQALIVDLPVLDNLKNRTTVYDVDPEEIEGEINSESLNDSLAGKIMMSVPYLKAFYPQNPPSFNKLPEDTRFELMDAMKKRNAVIIAAFEKLRKDRENDRKRKVLNVLAQILKIIQMKSEKPLNRLSKPAEEVIRSIFVCADEVFVASQRQVTDLLDTKKINDLLKLFFLIKQFKDISELSVVYKEEIERFRKRSLRAKNG